MSKSQYGEKIHGYSSYVSSEGLITDMGSIRLLHLDGPSRGVIKARVEEILSDEDDIYDGDCLLCRSLKDTPQTIVFCDGGQTNV